MIKLVEAVDVHLEGFGANGVALQEFLLDVGFARHRREGWQPVEVADDIVRYRARFDMTGPADHVRHTIDDLPIGVLLASEQLGRASSRERVYMDVLILVCAFYLKKTR